MESEQKSGLRRARANFVSADSPMADRSKKRITIDSAQGVASKGARASHRSRAATFTGIAASSPSAVESAPVDTCAI